MECDNSVDVDVSVSVDITLTAKDIQDIVGGYEIEDDDGEVKVTVSYMGSPKGLKAILTADNKDESPLDYLERTWNEPRYGETPLQHFNRIHGVSE